MKYIASPVADGGATGINDNGLISGTVGSGAAAQRAYIGSVDGATLVPLANVYNSQGLGIGGDNEIVGTATSADRRSVAAWKYEDGQINWIPGLGGTMTSAAASNGTVIVGSASTPRMIAKPIRYEAGRTSELATLGGPAGAATAINTSGVICGQTRIADGNMITRACRWQDGGVIDLGSLLPSGSSWAWSINNGGDVVGTSDSPAGRVGVKFAGGTISQVTPGQGVAFGINDAGIIVGHMGVSPATLAFVNDGSGAVDLNTITTGAEGWTLTVARAINNHGWIVAVGQKGSAFKTFVLEPVA